MLHAPSASSTSKGGIVTPKRSQPTRCSHHAEDLSLARAVARGDALAWATFIERYGRLLESVIRRHAGCANDEEVRDAYVHVLERLYKRRLKRYEGRSRLSTWLVVVTRNLAVDDLRRRQGRIGIPSCLSRLSDSDRRLYELVIVERLPFHVVRQRMGLPPTEDLVDAMERVERALDGRLRMRLAYDAWGRELGIPGPVLRFVEAHEAARATSPEARTPEESLIARELAAQAREVCRRMETLPETEREALRLRYFEELPPREIAVALSLPSRRIYKILETAIARLRRSLRAGDVDVFG